MWNTPSQEQLANIPPLGSQAKVKPEDVMIYLHFFMGDFNWWISEYDGQDTFFGFANLGDPEMAEWGTVSFQDLKDRTHSIPLYSMDSTQQQSEKICSVTVEVNCDKYWQPEKFSVVWPLS